VKLDMSTAFHPQSDGQTERTNRTLEQYLRHYISHNQDDWDLLLTAAEFAYNNAQSASTRLSPFEVCNGRSPMVSPVLLDSGLLTETGNPTADDFASTFSRLLGSARDNLHLAQQHQAEQANKTRTPLSFKVGDKVLLSTENYSTAVLAKASPKLTARFIGPYEILSSVSKGAYQIKVPTAMKIHPVIPVSALKAFVANPPEFSNRDPPRPPPVLVDGEPEYHVESIVKHKKLRGETVFLVMWKGYPKEDASWEPADNLKGNTAFEDYKRRHRLRIP